MITVRTKGVALSKPLPVDEDGMSVFNLDESKFDQFDVLLRTMTKCGYTPPERDFGWERMLKARKQREEQERAERARRER